MPFEKKSEPAKQRNVRVTDRIYQIIVERDGTLANGIRNYAEQLTQLDENLKKLGK